MTKQELYFERAQALVKEHPGMTIGSALERVAQETGTTLNAVRTGYYTAARKHGMGRKKKAPARAPRAPRTVKPGTNGSIDPGDATLKELIEDLERAQTRLVVYVAKRDALLQELRAVVVR